MTVPKAPIAALSVLQRADGSANYSWNGYSIIGAVNGPIEVQRRDELPEEAAIDVVVRPAAGVGGIRIRCMSNMRSNTETEQACGSDISSPSFGLLSAISSSSRTTHER